MSALIGNLHTSALLGESRLKKLIRELQTREESDSKVLAELIKKEIEGKVAHGDDYREPELAEYTLPINAEKRAKELMELKITTLLETVEYLLTENSDQRRHANTMDTKLFDLSLQIDKKKDK